MLATYWLYQNKLTEVQQASLAVFEKEAELRAKDIESEFKRSFFQVASVGNLFSSSSWVDHQEFIHFVERVYPEFPQGRRLSIISYLDTQKLPQFIDRMRGNTEVYFKNFHLFDFRQQSRLSPTIEGQKTIVLTYSYPIADKLNFYGRVINNWSPIYSKLLPVITDKKALITDLAEPIVPITLKPFFLYLYPIIKLDEQGQQALAGIVTSSQYIVDVFKSNLVAEQQGKYDYVVEDSNGNQYLYPEQVYVPAERAQIYNNATTVFSHPIDIVGNQWQLFILPKRPLSEHSNELLSNIWLFGCIISVTLAMLAKVIFVQQEVLARQVSIKTKQLKKQNLELENAVERANQAAKVKSEFLANMSHEIRTPLNGVVGFTEILKDTELNKEQSEYLNKMEYSAKHLMTVINDILDFSKIESGQIELEQAPMSIYSIIDYVQMSFEDLALQKELYFIINIADNFHPDLMGDLVRVNQVLLNLCSNAFKFTSSGGVTLDIWMNKIVEEPECYQVSFKVTDTGVGMKPEVVAKLFQAFTQADTSTTRRFGGTGLGLTISQKLCQLMGGEIEVESEEGVGSTFTARMKLRQNNKVLIYDGEKQSLARPIEVLIIDDNQMSLSVLSQFVENMNARATPVLNATQGLKLVVDDPQRFDLILLDWAMPEVDGLQFMLELVKLDLKKKPQVIVITAYNIAKIEHAAKNLPILAIMQKPCSEKQLFSCIEKGVIEKSNELALAQNEKQSLEGIHILVVEDNEINQIIIQQILESEGVSTQVANNGKECLSFLFNESTFDLILMDIHMPEMDGIEATKQIRQSANIKISTLPIIALTANVMPKDVKHYLSSGMNAHISKPIDKEQLKRTILQLV